MRPAYWIALWPLLLLAGCGVKGKPQAPLTPLGISRGEPSFSKATERVKVTPGAKKKKIEGDFEEPGDFDAEPEDKK